MRTGLIRRHIGQQLGSHGAKRPAGRRQQYAPHALAGKAALKPRRQRLENRIVFAVNRQNRGATETDRIQKYRPGHHQGLLVRQQDALAGACRTQCGTQPRRADDRGDHGIHLACLRHLDRRGITGQNLGAQPGDANPLAQHRRGGRIGENGIARPVRHTLCEHLIDTLARNQGMHLEPVRMPGHHIERAFADRSGRAEQGQMTHALLSPA